LWKKLPALGITRRVGQLALADGDDGVGDLARAWFGDFVRRQFLPDVGVAQVRLPGLGQPEKTSVMTMRPFRCQPSCLNTLSR
jgi:hypothetical protein